NPYRISSVLEFNSAPGSSLSIYKNNLCNPPDLTCEMTQAAGRLLREAVGDGGSVEDVAGSCSDAGEDPPDLTGLLAPAVLAAPVGDPAEARQRCDRPVDDVQDLAERDHVSPLQEHIAAELSPAARHDAVVLEIEEDLLEELARDALLFRDVADHARSARLVRLGEGDESSQGIFGLLRDHRGVGCLRAGAPPGSAQFHPYSLSPRSSFDQGAPRPGACGSAREHRWEPDGWTPEQTLVAAAGG